MRTLKRIITAPLVFIAAVILLLEDWLWDDLQGLAQWVGRLPVFHQFESFIVRLPPTGALLVFLVPSVILVPIKLLALWLISGGHAPLGVSTIIAAKIAGTALVARLFKLTKSKLLTFGWFAWAYDKIVRFKSRIYSVIKSTVIYQAAQRILKRLRERLRAWRSDKKSWLRLRWRAIRRRARTRQNSDQALRRISDAQRVKNHAHDGRRRKGRAGKGRL